MKTLVIFGILLAGSSAASADDSFTSRVQRAKLVEDSQDGKAYQQHLWKQAGSHTATVMQHCFKKGVKADTDHFTLIGDVLSGGTLSNVEVRPKTTMSQCFADGFRSAPFPTLPASFAATGMPIVIEMKVTPYAP